MRDHSNHIELRREECIQSLIDASNFEPGTETVSLHDALGRVTAADCTSKYDLPSALCAGMDGIAVRYDDFTDADGNQIMPDVASWEYGREYDWANTGTAVPDGYDTSIAIEACTFDEGGRLTALAHVPSARGDNCSEPGSSVKKGQLIVGAHTRLTPTKISALAMVGYTEVEVVCKPKVVFIPTGDELVAPGVELPRGKAYETNGIMLEMKLRTWGAEPVVYDVLPDDWDQIKAAIEKAAAEADIVAINAGSSKGAKDFTMEILEEIGTVFCHETNHGPGRHTSASVVDGTPVLGLSGPPSGCEITADWYLKPLVDSYLFGEAHEFDTVIATLAEGLPGGGGHGGPGAGGGPGGGRPGGPGAGGPSEGFFAIKPVKVTHTIDGDVAEFVGGPGRHASLMALDEADGYLEMNPRAASEYVAGSKVEVRLRYPYTAG